VNKANIFMIAGWVGLASLVLYVAGSVAFTSEPIAKASAYLTVGACWAMLFTRNADEYTRALWTSAASLAFATLLILFLGLPAAEGFYDGFRTAIEDRPDDYYQQDIKAGAIIGCGIVAFYIGLFWKRFRGGM
jgi:hypothetical protein